MPNYELGFGSPFYTNQTNGDMGFGAPYSITVGATSYSTTAELGFGDNYSPVTISFISSEETITIGDEGGQYLKLYGNWGELINNKTQRFVGPFKIYLVNETENHLCYSGLPGYPHESWADSTGKFVSFIVPQALPHGTYNIEIYYGSEYSQLFTLTDAIRVMKGTRNLYSKTLRKNMPKFYNTGLYSDSGKNTETIYNVDKSNLEKILDSIADEFDTIISGQYTVLTQKAQIGDTTLHVESTLNFPTQGILKLGNQELIYSAKTDTTFTLLNYIKEIQPLYSQVVYLNTELEKIDNYYLRQVYQYDKPTAFEIRNNQWDETFKYLQFAERYSYINIHNYFSALTQHVDFEKTCVLANANEQVFIITDINEEFNLSHVDRFIEINGYTYYSIGLVDTAHISNPLVTVKGLKLAKTKTAYWRKAEFSVVENLTLKVKPFNIDIDYDGKFGVIYENTIFMTTPGFINKDFIDYNIYFEDYTQIGERNFNSEELGNSDMTAAGIIPLMKRKPKASVDFGTYIDNRFNPNLIVLEPDNQIE